MAPPSVYQNVAGGEVSDEGNTYGANLGLSVPLRSWLNLSLFYGYRQFNGGDPVDDYTENRAQVTLSAGF